MKNNKNHSTPQTNKMKEKLIKNLPNSAAKAGGPLNNSHLNKSLKSDTLELISLITNDGYCYNKPNIIFLNPSTILSTSFNFFGYVVAEHNNECVVCLLYPDQSVATNCVLITDFVSTSLNIENENEALITLTHVQQRIPIANELVLEYKNSTVKKDDPIFEYACQQLEGMVIKNDNIISLKMLGNRVNFKVVRLLASTLYDQMNSTLAFNASKESIDDTELNSLMGNLTLFNETKNKLKDGIPSSNGNVLSTENNQKFGLLIKKTLTIIQFVSAADNERFIGMDYNKIERHKPADVHSYGFDKVLNDLYNMIILPLKNINSAKASGLIIPHGLLIYGHRGCGKTLILEKLCENSGVKFLWIDLRKIKNEYEDPIAHISNIFDELKSSAEPTIFILEDCETYYPQYGRELLSEQFDDLCQMFLLNIMTIRKMDRKTIDIPFSIIGTCSNISSLSTSIHPNGIFDIEYEIPIPTSDERFEILKGLLSQMKHKLDDEQLTYLANHTHGYLPKDLVLLVQLSSVQALIRYNGINDKSNNPLEVIYEDFVISLREINPSIIKAFTTDIPKIRWEDIGGMEGVKNHLKECILWPILYPDTLKYMGLESSGGVLLYGPPGCSKTMMARALAGESQMNFISIKGPELLNKYVGETEKTIRDLFKKARLATPCILFFDEMDAIASQRDTSSVGYSDFNDRILAQFLTEIDGISGNNLNLFVVAATNRPFSIDSALMRPGRFDRLVYVPLPDSVSRKSIFELQFKRIPIDSTIDITTLVESTKGYSGAEIVALCKEAAYCALREDLTSRVVSMPHFKQALTCVHPRVTSTSLQMYASFKDQHYRV